MKVSLESGKTLELLANICGSRRVFAEIFSQATGLKSGYQVLTNTIRAHKGMSPKHMESFLHNLHHAEGDNNLVDYKDDLRYMYYLLDYLVEAGIIEKDDSMRIDALSPKEERQMERRFGDGYEPKGDGNVEGLSDDVNVVTKDNGDSVDSVRDGGGEPETGVDLRADRDGEYNHGIKNNLDKEEEIVNVEEQEETTQEKDDGTDVDDILSQLLAFGGKQDDTARKEDNNTENVERPIGKRDSFLDNFLGGQSKPSIRPSVSSDGFDSDLADVPDVFDKDSKKF